MHKAMDDIDDNDESNVWSLEIEREEMEGLTEGYSERVELEPWKKQITFRGLVASVLIGSMFSVIAMKLNLTTGITPNLNVSAALVAFILIAIWTNLLQKIGIISAPFTKQENTMIQTCSVACYSLALGGGFGSYLLAMNKKTFEQSGGTSIAGNSPSSIKEPGIGWMSGFLVLVCFVGLFLLIPLRKILIVDNDLTFPTGMTTAVLINGLHSRGDKMANEKQVRGFVKTFSASFLWGFFQWFYTAKEDCGFSHFPLFGLQARKKTFYFDFSLTYVGTGMICPHNVNLSLLLGAVLSYGIMWPLIGRHKGNWFPANIPESSMQSLNGYKVFISIALLLGDGLYNFVKILCIALANRHSSFNSNFQSSEPGFNQYEFIGDHKQYETENNRIPLWLGVTGYLILAVASVIVIPFIFPQLKWYFVLFAYILTPLLAFCNAYGAGLTDFNMSYNYGKVGLFIVAAMSGKEHGVLASLAASGLFISIANVSCILVQDFKMGHLTSASPRAMLLSQGVGTALGCIISPLSFFLFYKAFDIGNPDGEFKAPLAIIYRNLAIIGVQGFSALPQHCLQLCYGFFGLALVINLVRDFLPTKIGKWMPVPTAMAVPFLVGGYFAIDMCVGTLVVFVWQKFINFEEAELMVRSVASGFICGEGLWILPASVLALAKVRPPICMNFLSA